MATEQEKISEQIKNLQSKVDAITLSVLQKAGVTITDENREAIMAMIAQLKSESRGLPVETMGSLGRGAGLKVRNPFEASIPWEGKPLRYLGKPEPEESLTRRALVNTHRAYTLLLGSDSNFTNVASMMDALTTALGSSIATDLSQRPVPDNSWRILNEAQRIANALNQSVSEVASRDEKKKDSVATLKDATKIAHKRLQSNQ